ncbi:hypothetical protein [Aquimixticola soesokkakensis]|nr:hypothetical protein [Aquimixticola soesokkakensis]
MAALSRVAQKEQAQRAILDDLDAQLAQCQAALEAATDIEAFQISGTDANFRLWLTQQRRQEMRKLSQLAALREDQTERVRTAFGRDEVMGKLCAGRKR